MASVDIKFSAQLRDHLGQFERDCSEAAAATIREAIKDGERLSIAFAPDGHKVDPRTIPLKASIRSVQTGRTTGYWGSFGARQARPIEFGAAAHDIPGDVGFFWEREGRWWRAGLNTIRHPGNAAQPFMRPAAKIVKERLKAIAKSKYPGS